MRNGSLRFMIDLPRGRKTDRIETYLGYLGGPFRLERLVGQM
jgi:hypothetical protein